MPLHESEAIVLRSYPLAEADRLVSFLSRTMGRVRGVAAGARRTKSRFGSTLQSLSHVRIWYYERETRDLVRINQCEMIESFLDAFGDYASSVALALFSEITEAVLPEREAADANFRLLLLSAQTVKRTRKSEVPLAYFTLWTVKLGGWLPAFDVCVKCREPLFFSASAAAAFCPNCRRSEMRPVSPKAFSEMRRMLLERLDRISEGSVSPLVAREIADIMLDVIEQQIDRKLTSRRQLELPA